MTVQTLQSLTVHLEFRLRILLETFIPAPILAGLTLSSITSFLSTTRPSNALRNVGLKTAA
ncbi:MAG: hypothetical protein WBY44_02185 [Bryobacteraceae bacterium]